MTRLRFLAVIVFLSAPLFVHAQDLACVASNTCSNHNAKTGSAFGETGNNGYLEGFQLTCPGTGAQTFNITSITMRQLAGTNGTHIVLGLYNSSKSKVAQCSEIALGAGDTGEKDWTCSVTYACTGGSTLWLMHNTDGGLNSWEFVTTSSQASSGDCSYLASTYNATMPASFTGETACGGVWLVAYVNGSIASGGGPVTIVPRKRAM